MDREKHKESYLSFCPCCLGKTNKTILAISKHNQSFKKLSRERYQGVLEEITPDNTKIEIKLCNICNHHWYPWTPKEEQLIKMYDKHIRKGIKNLGTKSKKTKYINKELKDQIRFIKNKYISFLDYGSGLGIWTNIAIKNNLTTYAFEPSFNRISESDLSNIFVINDLSDLNRTFDLINFEQVLEHVVDPKKILLNIMPFLKPNSILRIRVPNIKRSKEGTKLYSEWPYTGKRMHTLSPYEHLHGFTQDSLNILCLSVGLKVHYKFAILKRPIWLLRYFLGKFHKYFSTTTIYCKKQ